MGIFIFATKNEKYGKNTDLVPEENIFAGSLTLEKGVLYSIPSKYA